MAKKEKTVEELQADLAALQSEKAALEEVVAGQNETLENLGAEKEHKAPVLTYKKTKYKVLANSCVVKVDGEQKKVVLTEEGKKVASDDEVAAILAIEGQCILEKLTAKS